MQISLIPIVAFSAGHNQLAIDRYDENLVWFLSTPCICYLIYSPNKTKLRYVITSLTQKHDIG